MKQKPIRLDENLYKLLSELKEKEGIPIAESLRRAVIEYLEKKKIKIK